MRGLVFLSDLETEQWGLELTGRPVLSSTVELNRYKNYTKVTIICYRITAVKHYEPPPPPFGRHTKLRGIKGNNFHCETSVKRQHFLLYVGQTGREASLCSLYTPEDSRLGQISILPLLLRSIYSVFSLSLSPTSTML